jgi:FkbM family methyltransferase
MQIEQFYGHTIHPRFLDRESIVLDLGANRGEFAQQIIRRFGCRCYAVEANPAMCAVIPTHERLRTFNFAVARANGTLPFHVRQNSESSSLAARDGEEVIGTVDVPAKRLDEFVQSLGLSSISLAKFDIEGAEIDVIASCSDDFLRSIAQITIEFHDFDGTTPARAVIETLQRFTRLGFVAFRMSHHGHADTMLINRARCSISSFECLWIRCGVRNWRGLKRITQRRFAPPRRAEASPIRDPHRGRVRLRFDRARHHRRVPRNSSILPAAARLAAQ